MDLDFIFFKCDEFSVNWLGFFFYFLGRTWTWIFFRCCEFETIGLGIHPLGQIIFRPDSSFSREDYF